MFSFLNLRQMKINSRKCILTDELSAGKILIKKIKECRLEWSIKIVIIVYTI